jgi:dTDP-4-dehydrorhamnose 3,5-epimerase
MRIEQLPLAGVVLVAHDVSRDSRGSFRRVIDLAELAGLGLDARVSQVSAATNDVRGTVRGMHFQVHPHEESKTIWCMRGSVFDVLVDVRPDQPTYGSWCSVTLREGDGLALHVPPGIAHGYQTLEDDSALVYMMSAPHHQGSARTLLWSDPTVGITWPAPVTRISDRDREAPPWPPQR